MGARRHGSLSTETPGNSQESLFPLPHCDGISVWPGVFCVCVCVPVSFVQSVKFLHPTHIQTGE